MSGIAPGMVLSWLEPANGGQQLIRASVQSLGRKVSLVVQEVKAGRNAQSTVVSGETIWRYSGQLINGMWKLHDLQERQSKKVSPSPAATVPRPAKDSFNKPAGSKPAARPSTPINHP